LGRVAAFALVGAGVGAATDLVDCEAASVGARGAYATANYTTTWNETIFTVIHPVVEEDTAVEFPLVGFMHGSTGQYEFYNENLELYVSHGFVVVFPYVKSPEKDKNPLTTNTDGTFLLKAVDFAKAQTANASSPLAGLVDTGRIALAGHSMGATCTIMAASKVEPGAVRVAVSQHPGICGPFGPPPWPATWLKSDLAKVTAKMPFLMTTATNDGAFWPAPYTAQHEFGCFDGTNFGANDKAAFVEFSDTACADDGAREPLVDDGGHDCPMKFADGGRPETPWVLTALKLYTHLDGAKDSNCYKMLWGNTTASLAQSPDAAKVSLRGV